MPSSEAKKRADARWKAKHEKTVACSVNVDEYNAFKAYAEKNGKTVSGMLLAYIRECINDTDQHGAQPAEAKPRSIRRRGFKLDGMEFLTLEDLQSYLRSIDIDVTDNVILNYISKGRLSAENREKYPSLLRIEKMEYTQENLT